MRSEPCTIGAALAYLCADICTCVAEAISVLAVLPGLHSPFTWASEGYRRRARDYEAVALEFDGYDPPP